MLIYTEDGQRLVPAQCNVITLKADDAGYVYVDKTTYEQATILADKYNADYDGLCKLVGVERHQDYVDYFYNNMPEPINFLAPFISLIEDNAEFDGTLEELVGCVHIISRSIDFQRFIRVPADIRRTVSFSDHIRTEYEIQWQSFFNESVPYAMIYDVFAKEGTFAQAHMPDLSTPTGNPFNGSSHERYHPGDSATKKHIALDNGEEMEITVDEDAAGADILLDDPDLLAALMADVDTESEEFKAGVASIQAENEEKDKEKARGGSSYAPSATEADNNAALPEAQSGKSLLDNWGL